MIKEIDKSYPLEAEEQENLVKILRRCKVSHFAVPNGGFRRPVEGARLKRQRGGKIEPEQQEWHDRLEAYGWRVLVAYGCADAVRQLRELGIIPE